MSLWDGMAACRATAEGGTELVMGLIGLSEFPAN